MNKEHKYQDKLSLPASNVFSFFKACVFKEDSIFHPAAFQRYLETLWGLKRSHLWHETWELLLPFEDGMCGMPTETTRSA